MKVIGLTGGIGTGKSTAAEYLHSKGFAVIDADQIGRDMTADGSPLLAVLDEMFGSNGPYGRVGVEILSAPGVLDRKAMASLVFSNDEIRYKFNEIMHSAIIDEIKREIASYEIEGKTHALIDAPLLFEAGVNRLCDRVILITAALEKRIERVVSRDHMTREEIVSRIKSQMDDSEKAALSDFVVDNSGSLEELYGELDKVLEYIKQ